MRLRAASSDVQDVIIAKAQLFLQLTPNDVFVDPFTPFAAMALAEGTASGSLLGGSFSFFNGTPITLVQSDPTSLRFAETFSSFDQLSAAFPDATYSLTLQTANPPSPFNAAIDLRYNPPAIPQIVNSDWNTVVIQMDVRQQFTFRWNAFPNFSTDPAHPSFIDFQIADIFNGALSDDTFDTPVSGLRLPANFLMPGIYVGRLSFVNGDASSVDSADLLGATYSITQFIISAVDGPPAITSPTAITVNAGQLFVYTLEATNVPARLDDVSGLPSDGSMQFSPAGFIGGYPTQPGTYQLGLSLSNLIGAGTATLTLNVLPASGLAITSSTRAAAGIGDPFRFQVLAPGATSAARLTTSSLPAGLSVNAVTGEIAGTPTQPGDYAVQLRVTDGAASTEGVLLIKVSADPAFPTIRSATSVALTPGRDFTYKISGAPDTVVSSSGFGTNATDQTQYSLLGKLPVGLSFDPKTGTISGKYQGSAIRDHETARSRLAGGALVGNVQLFATNSRGTSTVPLVFFTSPTGAVNISTRLAIANGDNVLIGGFIVTGNAPKKLIVRALGPSLPVQGALPDPVLEIHGSDGSLLAMNDSWKSDDAQSVIDSGVAPRDDREAAIVGAFQPNVNYTAIVKGKDGATGVALVELYDLGTAALDSNSTAKLANISTRGFVQTGDNVMIGGFIISQVQSQVIARAIGPSLANAGVQGALQDTVLELHSADGALVGANDDWQSDQAQQIKDTGVPPTDPRESAVLATLKPGNYTAVVRGKNNTTGVALVEIYALQ